ncbi:MAG TPA: 2Fe-2S iron-sulfur cluster-binding protein [Kofleriaceae bacterium]|nr:2Fe-2S iron-sulfur cluster-binding protein [Kofleriaceae bacterium]
MRHAHLRAGDSAPSFVLHEASGLSCSSPRGIPWVLAFARGWVPDGRDEEQAAIRAELRGLGADMIVVADAGVWSFRPDDDLERFATPAPRLASDIAAVAERYGVAPGTDAAFVIDEAGVVRFAHTPADRLAVHLPSALGAATNALRRARRAGRGISRRDFAVHSLVAGFGLALLPSCHRKRPTTEPPLAANPPAEGEVDIVLEVNGTEHKLRVEPRVSLLDALRERLGLTGSKKGCDAGQCGACTVLAGGRAVNACLTLAIAAQGTPITTIEGLARGDALHPVQAAFVSHDGFQCGYCTPGQILSAVALLSEGRAVTDDQVREQMSGNLCRCGAYPNIVAAIQSARKAS